MRILSKRSATLALGMVAAAGLFTVAAPAQAATTVTVYPNQVPDETTPRTGNTAPTDPAGTDWGTTSWQGPATGKSNFNLRYTIEGDVLGQLFGDSSAITLGDLTQISYWTNRPDGTANGHDWWVEIFTVPTQDGDQGGWYHQKFWNNYTAHTTTGQWVQYSSSANGNGAAQGMSFSTDGSNYFNLTDLDGLYGDQQIESISIETDSGWNGFDGLVDGLHIALTNQEVGNVNFDARPQINAAPVPSSIWLALAACGGLGLMLIVRRRRLVA